MVLLLFCLLFLFVQPAVCDDNGGGVGVGKSPPSYDSSSYIVHGFLQLPYAEINEPFTLYYDLKNNQSRVDYYDGMVKTFQLAGNAQKMYKIAYETTESVMNQLNCFKVFFFLLRTLFIALCIWFPTMK